MTGGQVIYGEEDELYDAVSVQRTPEILADGLCDKEGEGNGERSDLRNMDVESRLVGADCHRDNFCDKEDGEVYPVNLRECFKLHFNFSQKISHLNSTSITVRSCPSG